MIKTRALNGSKVPFNQSRTVTEYICLSTVLKYNFEGSVLYSSIIFWEYSWLYSSTFERQILYSLLRYISIHNREYPLLLLKNKRRKEKSRKPSICCFPLKRDSLSNWLGQPSAYQQSPLLSAKANSMVRIRWETIVDLIDKKTEKLTHT